MACLNIALIPFRPMFSLVFFFSFICSSLSFGQAVKQRSFFFKESQKTNSHLNQPYEFSWKNYYTATIMGINFLFNNNFFFPVAQGILLFFLLHLYISHLEQLALLQNSSAISRDSSIFHTY